MVMSTQHVACDHTTQVNRFQQKHQPTWQEPRMCVWCWNVMYIFTRTNFCMDSNLARQVLRGCQSSFKMYLLMRTGVEMWQVCLWMVTQQIMNRTIWCRMVLDWLLQFKLKLKFLQGNGFGFYWSVIIQQFHVILCLAICSARRYFFYVFYSFVFVMLDVILCMAFCYARFRLSQGLLSDMPLLSGRSQSSHHILFVSLTLLHTPT